MVGLFTASGFGMGAILRIIAGISHSKKVTPRKISVNIRADKQIGLFYSSKRSSELIKANECLNWLKCI